MWIIDKDPGRVALENCDLKKKKANKRRMALVFLFLYFSFSLFEEEA
jgi:hypothetical protein